MFDDTDPYLVRLREVCLALPGAAEKISHGRPNFFTQKVFAVFGGSLKGDHYAEQARNAVLVKADPLEAPTLLGHQRFFVPAYYGPSGWVGLSFLPAGSPAAVDWAEVADLVEMSYRLTAPAKLVRQL
jgi:predicted DNA-binding protein (MmcQ/YjbR family)